MTIGAFYGLTATQLMFTDKATLDMLFDFKLNAGVREALLDLYLELVALQAVFEPSKLIVPDAPILVFGKKTDTKAIAELQARFMKIAAESGLDTTKFNSIESIKAFLFRVKSGKDSSSFPIDKARELNTELADIRKNSGEEKRFNGSVIFRDRTICLSAASTDFLNNLREKCLSDIEGQSKLSYTIELCKEAYTDAHMPGTKFMGSTIRWNDKESTRPWSYILRRRMPKYADEGNIEARRGNCQKIINECNDILGRSTNGRSYVESRMKSIQQSLRFQDPGTDAILEKIQTLDSTIDLENQTYLLLINKALKNPIKFFSQEVIDIDEDEDRTEAANSFVNKVALELAEKCGLCLLSSDSRQRLFSMLTIIKPVLVDRRIELQDRDIAVIELIKRNAYSLNRRIKTA